MTNQEFLHEMKNLASIQEVIRYKFKGCDSHIDVDRIFRRILFLLDWSYKKIEENNLFEKGE